MRTYRRTCHKNWVSAVMLNLASCHHAPPIASLPGEPYISIHRIDLIHPSNTSCLVTLADLSSLPSASVEEELRTTGRWNLNDPWARAQTAKECCAFAGGRLVGWEIVDATDALYAPLCGFGAGQDTPYLGAERLRVLDEAQRTDGEWIRVMRE
jgi:hypothetical protein